MVRRVVDIEMLRNGGSLSATFDDDHGERFILLIPIKRATGRSLGVSRLGYGEPALIDCNPAKRPRDTDNVRQSVLSGPAVQLSWDDARRVLRAISTLAAGLGALQSKWLQMMVDVAAREGRVD
jgi:hypothetical protein